MARILPGIRRVVVELENGRTFLLRRGDIAAMSISQDVGGPAVMKLELVLEDWHRGDPPTPPTPTPPQLPDNEAYIEDSSFEHRYLQEPTRDSQDERDGPPGGDELSLPS